MGSSTLRVLMLRQYKQLFYSMENYGYHAVILIHAAYRKPQKLSERKVSRLTSFATAVLKVQPLPKAFVGKLSRFIENPRSFSLA